MQIEYSMNKIHGINDVKLTNREFLVSPDINITQINFYGPYKS